MTTQEMVEEVRALRLAVEGLGNQLARQAAALERIANLLHAGFPLPRREDVAE